MIPDLISGTDCRNPVDYYTWEGFLGDAWIIIPFLMGMLFYKLFNGLSFPLQQNRLLADDDCCDYSDISEKKLCFEEVTPQNSGGHGNEKVGLW